MVVDAEDKERDHSNNKKKADIKEMPAVKY